MEKWILDTDICGDSDGAIGVDYTVAHTGFEFMGVTTVSVNSMKRA